MSIGGSGYKAWLIQRVSAVYMALFLIYFVAGWLVCAPQGFADWAAWMSSLPMALATAMFFIAMLGHAWVGMRDVLIDYVKSTALRFALMAGLAFSLMALGLWAVKVLLVGNL